jgi:hypothetical protein
VVLMSIVVCITGCDVCLQQLSPALADILSTAVVCFGGTWCWLQVCLTVEAVHVVDSRSSVMQHCSIRAGRRKQKLAE